LVTIDLQEFSERLEALSGKIETLRGFL